MNATGSSEPTRPGTATSRPTDRTGNGWLCRLGSGFRPARRKIRLVLQWRIRTIFATNSRTSYMAGRLAMMRDPDVVRIQPWWQYIHAESRTPMAPRPQHLFWDRLVLRWGDPWWDIHFPPNDWMCSCGVRAMSERRAATPLGCARTRHDHAALSSPCQRHGRSARGRGFRLGLSAREPLGARPRAAEARR
ncbi:MAG: phage minor head protein [Paenirhodobacter sp.]